MTPDALDDTAAAVGGYYEYSFQGSWAGKTAGGCANEPTFANNPQFIFTLQESDEDEDELATCVVALMQRGSRRRSVQQNRMGKYAI